MPDTPRQPSDHNRALNAVLETASRVAHDEWNQAAGEGKWSPAQVVEHLRLTYVTLRAELGGRGGFRIRLGWWRQRLVRWRYLSRILREGRFPPGVPAVREIRPGQGPYEQAALLAALRSEGEQFERELRAAVHSGRRLSHPFLGALGSSEALVVTAQHLRHHERQLTKGTR